MTHNKEKNLSVGTNADDTIKNKDIKIDIMTIFFMLKEIKENMSMLRRDI